MERKYVCPVCNKEGTLSDLNACIIAHMNEAKDEAEKLRQNEIETLKAENMKLVTAIEKNCKRLDELGLKANINYTIAPTRKSTTSNPKYERKENFSNLEDFIKALYKDIF